MTTLSFLDFVSVREGGTFTEAFAESAELARAAEAAGYRRYWVAEHHGMPAIASSATAVVLAHVGHATSTIRIGAGGIMLPNHNPLVIAEQFGTLDAMFPGRVDLGLWPGARRGRPRRPSLAQGSVFIVGPIPRGRRGIAAPVRRRSGNPDPGDSGAGAQVQMWILGSSLFGAQLAAHLGLPYAFASHFAPAHLDAALKVYRERFQPSQYLDRPHVMAAMTVIAAETDEEAVLLSSSMDQSYIALLSGLPGRLLPPVAHFRENLSPQSRDVIERMREASAIGSEATVAAAIRSFLARTQADELIVAASIYDHGARLRSLALTMAAAGEHVAV